MVTSMGPTVNRSKVLRKAAARKSRSRPSRGGSTISVNRLRGDGRPASSSPKLHVTPGLLLCCHPDRPVEPYDLAVEHLVLDNVPHERGVLLGLAEAGREGDLVAQRFAGFLGETSHHGGIEDAGGDRHDADAV